MTQGIALNPAPDISFRTIGQEGEPLFIADNVLLDPEALTDCARRDEFAPPTQSFYPGLIASLPDVYSTLMAGVLRWPLSRGFGVHPDYRFSITGFFGLATLPAEGMSLNQAAPHTDTHRLHSFATVHYLSHADLGGTAFYRHKATGFELITPSRSDKFAHIRRTELAQLDAQPAAAVRDLYDEIDYVEPRYNRLVLYRAGQLHSARLAQGAGLSGDPNTGRLTANLFFNLG